MDLELCASYVDWCDTIRKNYAVKVSGRKSMPRDGQALANVKE